MLSKLRYACKIVMCIHVVSGLDIKWWPTRTIFLLVSQLHRIWFISHVRMYVNVGVSNIDIFCVSANPGTLCQWRLPWLTVTGTGPRLWNITMETSGGGSLQVHMHSRGSDSGMSGVDAGDYKTLEITCILHVNRPPSTGPLKIWCCITDWLTQALPVSSDWSSIILRHKWS